MHESIRFSSDCDLLLLCVREGKREDGADMDDGQKKTTPHYFEEVRREGDGTLKYCQKHDNDLTYFKVKHRR